MRKLKGPLRFLEGQDARLIIQMKMPCRYNTYGVNMILQAKSILLGGASSGRQLPTCFQSSALLYEVKRIESGMRGFLEGFGIVVAEDCLSLYSPYRGDSVHNLEGAVERACSITSLLSPSTPANHGTSFIGCGCSAPEVVSRRESAPAVRHRAMQNPRLRDTWHSIDPGLSLLKTLETWVFSNNFLQTSDGPHGIRTERFFNQVADSDPLRFLTHVKMLTSSEAESSSSPKRNRTRRHIRQGPVIQSRRSAR